MTCTYHVCDKSCVNGLCIAPGTQADCVACKKDYYISYTPTECLPCDISCNRCTGSGNRNCINCAKSSYLEGNICVYCGDNYIYKDGKCQCDKGFFLKNGECLADCGEGYFKNLKHKRCVACHSDCSICTSLEECQACVSGFRLF